MPRRTTPGRRTILGAASTPLTSPEFAAIIVNYSDVVRCPDLNMHPRHWRETQRGVVCLHEIAAAEADEISTEDLEAAADRLDREETGGG